ncbi:uncharacterized protein EV422DRAFT_192846 [Fimicolochytrium jonesii]|uniref:uncharacterized protein n=1 Tax=Fimicolochytrium jonesii TaxID=1396493 RepID=UPI0022FDD278|nr:uncharacterized protein EV422DRAFT_192846 [Fimicolochytrium jonesii]KAI8818163.1 hypothetical protein EV422DRAFT_192846 [Fimicolochytrium jonesii]
MTTMSIKWAKLASKYRENDHAGLQVTDSPDVDLQPNVPALRHSLQVALGIYSTELAMQTIADSFVDDISYDDITKAVGEIEVYVCLWAKNTLHGLHIDREHCPPGVACGNVFLNELDVKVLPTTAIHQWTHEERAFVMLLVWFLVHEMAHALVSVLERDGKITSSSTPSTATGFVHEERVLRQYQGTSPEGYVTGERGWFLEDRLGGHLKLLEKTFALYIQRPELKKYWRVGADVVEKILNFDYSVLPLARSGLGESMSLATEAYMKGRLVDDQDDEGHHKAGMKT